jgi:hypothetical protein
MMFAEEYGEIGIDYIHDHPVCPVASKKIRRMTDAKNDLVLVCPNCRESSWPPVSNPWRCHWPTAHSWSWAWPLSHCLEPMDKVGGASRGDVQITLGLLK